MFTQSLTYRAQLGIAYIVVINTLFSLKGRRKPFPIKYRKCIGMAENKGMHISSNKHIVAF